MTVPQITVYTGGVPNRATDSSTEFSDNADDMVAYIANVPDEYNDLADFVNAAASTAGGYSNFQGEWSSLTGAYSANISVKHNDILWLLLVDLTDITTSEPSDTNTDWQSLASFAQQEQNTADIATNTSDIATNAAEIEVVRGEIEVENLLNTVSPQNFNVRGDVDLPSTTSTDYSVGDEIWKGAFVRGDGIVGLTLDSDGIITWTSPVDGSAYIEIQYTKGQGTDISTSNLYLSVEDSNGDRNYSGDTDNLDITTDSDSGVYCRVGWQENGFKKIALTNGKGVVKSISDADSAGLTNIPEGYVYGSATFTNSTNSINLTGIGDILGIEIGDIISISGSTSNEDQFTVEEITDSDNIIVNEAHAGGSTTKSLTDETANVGVSILSKWHSAGSGTGQGLASVLSSRSASVTYQNETNREIHLYLRCSGGSVTVTIDGIVLSSGTASNEFINFPIPAGSSYLITINAGTIVTWVETR